MLKHLLVLASLLIPAVGAAQVTDWAPPREIADPRDSSVTLTIAGDPYYGFKKAWVKSGTTLEAMRELSSTEIQFEKREYWGRVAIYDGLDRTTFVENTAIRDVKLYVYWRDRIIDPVANGSFIFYGSNLRWIAFKGATPKGIPAECASFVAAGRGAKFLARAYWCMAGGRPMTEADVQGFAYAIGYKDLFSPSGLSSPPGR